MRYLSVWLPALLALVCATYVGAEPQTEAESAVLTVMGHDSTVIPEHVVAEFEERYGARVSILLAGDAGSALNRAILAQGNPLADVLYGVDKCVPEPGARGRGLRTLRATGAGQHRTGAAPRRQRPRHADRLRRRVREL